MLLSLLLATCAQLTLPHAPIAATGPEVQLERFASQDDHKAEYEAKKKAAGKDVEKLWELYLWCDAFGMEKEGRTTLRAILKEDPDHRGANEGLGYLEYDGKWFKTQKKLDEYKADEAKRRAEEEGLVEYKGEWVKAEDVPFLEKGLTRDADGNWISKEELEKTAAGWVKQDLEWISPEEKANIDKGLWKCGNDWLSLEEANKFHAKLGKWWVIPSDYFTVYSTCDREVALKALDHMERAQKDVARILGAAPKNPVPVLILRDAKQYGQFAAGDEFRPASDALGLSSVHYAYLADIWIDPETLDHHAAGVGYWDASTDAGNSWGVHSCRHAAAISLIEGADPSTKTEENLKKKKGNYPSFVEDYYKEKSLPAWFRNGASSYADRYFIDQFVGAGGNPNWAKDWSVQNLVGRGGLRPLKDIFTGEVSFQNADDSAKLLNERGLVMAFVLDGKCAPVTTALGAVKAALRDGKDAKKAIKDLEVEIQKHEKELRAFAGI
ncbi:MAG: hypothetical protein H6828_05030 [Planctomycetes bacterium]|nr:hypothetical protein [Planctomycetota bacterium]